MKRGKDRHSEGQRERDRKEGREGRKTKSER